MNSGPGFSRVSRFPKSGTGATAIEAPRSSAPLIRRRVKRLVVRRIHDQIGEARVFVDELDVVPGLAAVGGFEDAAFFVWAKQMAQHGDIDYVRIFRIDNDPRDGLRIGETHPGKGRAGVRRFVNPIAKARALAVVGLAGADPDDVRI